MYIIVLLVAQYNMSEPCRNCLGFEVSSCVCYANMSRVVGDNFVVFCVKSYALFLRRVLVNLFF